MFLITPEIVPVPAKAEITINFDPASKQSSNLKLTATGETVRATMKAWELNLPTLILFGSSNASSPNEPDYVIFHDAC